jgi:hypothetical protein
MIGTQVKTNYTHTLPASLRVLPRTDTPDDPDDY